MYKKLFTLLAIVFCLNAKAQIITTFAGNGIGAGTYTCCYSGDGGQATAAELNSPFGVDFDVAGNLYIVDQSNNRIRKVNTNGIISTVVGNGMAGYHGDGSDATVAELNYPTATAFDVAGNLYIVDNGNNLVRKVNTLGIITTVVGDTTGANTGTNNGYSGDGGQATSAKLNSPIGIALDNIGNLYIADQNNNRIRKINTLGIISTIVGNGIQGFSGDGGIATSAQIDNPQGLVFDAVGNMFIADYGNDRVRKVSTVGIISTFAGNGTCCSLGDGGQATAAELFYPTGITCDTEDNVYIADRNNKRIRKVNTLGIISTIAGNGILGYSGDGGQATVAEIADPTGVAFDDTGNMYIADYYNSRIRKVTNVGQATEMKQITSINEINIYPNPNNGNFIIESQNKLNNMHCTLNDVNGKLLLSQSINGKISIDASNLNEGVYNVSIISNEGVVNKRLVIVK
jgi:hypothetical protein